MNDPAVNEWGEAIGYAIRYKRGTDLAHRFPGSALPFASLAEAEALLRVCANAASMEIVEVVFP